MPTYLPVWKVWPFPWAMFLTMSCKISSAFLNCVLMLSDPKESAEVLLLLQVTMITSKIFILLVINCPLKKFLRNVTDSYICTYLKYKNQFTHVAENRWNFIPFLLSRNLVINNYCYLRIQRWCQVIKWIGDQLDNSKIILYVYICILFLFRLIRSF